MGRINTDHVNVHGYQGLHTLDGVPRNADRRAYDQSAQGILTGIRVVLHLHDVLIGDQADQDSVC
jgi:hypothetical protein